MDKETLFVNYIFHSLANKNTNFEFTCKSRLDRLLVMVKENDFQNKLHALAERGFPTIEDVTVQKIMILGLGIISTEFVDEEGFLASSKRFDWPQLVVFVNLIYRIRLMYPSKKTYLRFIAIKTLHCYCSDWLRKNLWSTENTSNTILAVLFSSCLLYTAYKLIQL
jgi:hypothetical protein